MKKIYLLMLVIFTHWIFFSIKYNDTKDNIMVTIPLNKSKFYYTTCFSNYEQALYYLLHHFKYFIHNK